MKDEFIKNVGIWGQRHYKYLKKTNPTVINVMRMPKPKELANNLNWITKRNGSE